MQPGGITLSVMAGQSLDAIEQYLQQQSAQIAGIGADAQERLRTARVHVSGFGGLGNSLAFLLSTAGVGFISANDPQNLEAENLGRFVCGSPADVGRPKVEAAARFFSGNSYLAFEPLVAGNGSYLVDGFYQQADWIVCASNTIESRIATARKAIRYRKSLIDIAVADGRSSWMGFIKYKLPECSWAACPACYLEPGAGMERGEALLFPIISTTASLTAHLLLQLITGFGAEALRASNFIAMGLHPPYQIETLAVRRRERCNICRT